MAKGPKNGAHAPNHHAGAHRFEGVLGYALALGMSVARGAASRALCDVAGIARGDRVVDVGCGPGTAAREAARRGARVIAVDPSLPMRRLGRWLTPTGLAVSWVDGLAEALPLSDASADIVWSMASVHHWPDVSAGLREAHRVLAPGGRLVIVEKRTKLGAKGLASHGWTDAQADTFAAMCAQAGFAQVRVEQRRLGRTPSLVVYARRGES